MDDLWEKENMVLARSLPGHWNNKARKLYCHRLAEPYLREALERLQARGLIKQVERIGCFNFRKQGSGSGKLSYHSWGIALDINPRDNGVRRFKNGTYPDPWSPEWTEYWPRGLSPELVECLESVGWSWGGRWKRFCDPMHFELVRR